jgi:hypothetical protein
MLCMFFTAMVSGAWLVGHQLNEHQAVTNLIHNMLNRKAETINLKAGHGNIAALIRWILDSKNYAEFVDKLDRPTRDEFHVVLPDIERIAGLPKTHHFFIGNGNEPSMNMIRDITSRFYDTSKNAVNLTALSPLTNQQLADLWAQTLRTDVKGAAKKQYEEIHSAAEAQARLRRITIV